MHTLEDREYSFKRYLVEQIVKATKCNESVARKLAHDLLEDFKDEIPKFNTVMAEQVVDLEQKIGDIKLAYNYFILQMESHISE